MIFLIPGIIAAVVALAAQRHSEAFRPFEQHDWLSRAAQLFYSLTFYLHKTLVPVNLSPLYELPLNPAEWYPIYIISAVLVVALTAGFFLARNRFPALLAGWLVYVVLLLPTSGIAQSGPQLVADRYSYFACMSWAVLAGAGFLTAQRRLWEQFLQRQYVLLAGIIIIGFLGTLTWRQTLIWRDSISLWRHALNIDPQSPYAHTNLGVAFGALGRFEDAAKEFTEAQRLNPTDADNYYNLGNILARQGHSAAAILQFESALRIRPRHADAHYELATLLAKNRDYARAITHFRSAIDARPSDARAHYNLAQMYATQAQWSSAVEHFRLALQYDPAHLRARMQLGKALSEMGDSAAAIAELKKILDREPTSAEAHEELARLYAKQGNKQQALQHFQETIKLLEKRQRSGH